MSRRRSLGELVPRDISEVVAREARAQRSHRTAGGSLGHAFSWLKGSRRKKSLGNKSLGNVLGGVGAGTAESPKAGRPNPDPIKAGPKASDEQKQLTVHFTASQHHHENVFIQGSRPQYLEDLHTEAQEGLKIQQREDYENGVDSQDDQSVNESTSSPTQERDAASKDRACSPESGSPTWNSASTATSTVSAVSTRPVLTRQGSTFKPLNPVKKFEKNKKRSRRTTILGIPQQVQKELALNRSSTFGASLLPNGGGQACDTQSALSSQEGTREHRSDMEASREEQLLQHHLQAVYQDDQCLGSHRLPPSSDQRPKSLAVPSMTSFVSATGCGFLQEPLGPVMSISPQATYLSKIIPNAVLPASVDVIQIERGNSRSRGGIHHHGGNSRAVSRSSLVHSELSGSPASSRRSGSDRSHNGSHNATTPTPATASGSNWSPTQSSETIVPQTSTVSFKPHAGTGSPQTVSLAGQESQRGEPRGDQVSLQSSTSCSSTTKDGSPGSSGQASDYGIGEREGMRTSHSCSRSLSIVKTKLPPAPPRRTNSLHHVEVAKRQAKQLVQIPDLNGSQRGDTGLADVKPSPVPVRDRSTVSPACSSLSPTLTPAPHAGGPPEPQPESSSASPRKAPPSEAGKFERTMSPSSGYSSQSGTPTPSPKGIPPTPPSSDKQKKRPVKPERSASRASSSAASASSSLTSLSSTTSDPVHQEALANSSSPTHPSSPPPVAAATEKAAPVKQTPLPATIRDFLHIPPHPKVKAPSPPPSETWAHNGRTIKLLCGLSPNIDRVAQLQKQQQLTDVNTVQNHKAETEESKPLKTVETDEKPTTKEDVVPPFTNGRVPLEKSEAMSIVCIRQELESPESRSIEPARLSVAEGNRASAQMQGQRPRISPLVEELKIRATLPKKETPPVMMKSTQTFKREEIVMKRQPQVKLDGVLVEVKDKSPVENDGPLKRSQVDVAACKNEATENASENKPMETQPPSQSLAEGSATVPKTSPPPSPPPAYHPPPPPARKTPPSSVSSPPPKEGEPRDEENIPPVESCWPPPPPPPPLQALVDSVFEGPEDMDFPPPPPPLLTDSLPDVVEGGLSEMDVPCLSVMSLEEVGASSKEDVMDEVAMNGESTELSPLQTQKLVGDVTSETTLGSSSHPGISERENSPKKDAPPLPQDVLPPQPDAPPPPPVTDGMPPSRSSLTPPSSVPPPPAKQLGEISPSGSPSSAPPASSISSTKSPAENNPTTVSFRRQPSLAGRDARAKELLARQKNAPVPKEDANIPLVTPSLLQMVRLRSVNVGDEPAKDHPEDNQPINRGASPQDPLPTTLPSSQSVPLKPIRKSLSLKSRPPTARAPPVTLNAPSTRLQEAIRMKTAAMSSRDGLTSRLSLRSSSSANSSVCDPAAPSPKSPDGGDIHKSPASTASFIFSRSAKKVVIEAPSLSSEAQASLKQSLVSELMKASDPSQVSNGTAEKADVHSSKYPGKVPPPVAKKPGLGNSNPAEKMGPDANGEIESTPPAGQTAPLKELQTTTKTVTPGTIETLF